MTTESDFVKRDEKVFKVETTEINETKALADLQMVHEVIRILSAEIERNRKRKRELEVEFGRKKLQFIDIFRKIPDIKERKQNDTLHGAGKVRGRLSRIREENRRHAGALRREHASQEVQEALDKGQVQRMLEHFKVEQGMSPSGVVVGNQFELTPEQIKEWTGDEGGKDKRGYFYWTTYNPENTSSATHHRRNFDRWLSMGLVSNRRAVGGDAVAQGWRSGRNWQA